MRMLWAQIAVLVAVAHVSTVYSFDWNLRVDTLNQTSFTAQPYVSNGYIGSRLPAVGVGYQEFSALADNAEQGGQGWPIFGPRRTATMVAGFYDVQNSTLGTNFPQTKGGEQVISLLPTWTSLYLTLRKDGGREATYAPGVNDDEVTDFKQTMSIRNGKVTTSLTWTAAEFEPVRLVYTVLAHRKRPNVGMMRLQVRGLQSGITAVVTDVLDGQGAQRTQSHHAGHARLEENVIYTTVQPNWVNNVTAWMFSALQPTQSRNADLQDASLPSSVRSVVGADDAATATQSYEIRSQQGEVDVWKAVGVATSDAYSPQERRVAFTSATAARQDGWQTMVEEHEEEWEEIWKQGGDVILNGEDEMSKRLQTQARASLFHLLTNVRRGVERAGLGDNSIAPAGLTSDSYAGSIFWDAETFMAPTLMLLFPSFVEPILYYRFKRPWQTIVNAQEHQRPGAIYPWVSARYQNETGIGPTYDYEYHLNNDIALLHWQYYQQTQNRTFLAHQAWPVLSRVADFWAAQVVKRDDGLYHTMNLTDPDEYANHVDDGAFTNAGIAILMTDVIEAADVLGRSREVPKNWSEIADKIAILQSNVSKITLEFDGFDGNVVVKQADVPLLIYPLEFHTRYPQKQPSPRSDLQYHASKTSSNGPGMTYSIYGIASAELSQTGCESYTRLLQAGLPYERQFAQFSEQVIDEYAENNGTNPAYTFLTGHGGLLQMYTHGFAGYRSREDRVYLDPSLPPQLAPQLSVKGIKHASSTLDVHIGAETTTVTHRSGKGDVVVEIGKRNADAGNYTLQVGESIEVATTRPSDARGGNAAQCRTVTASRPATGGNFVVGAVDGSNGTYYQPDSTGPTEVVIDMHSKREINNVHVNFAQLPPANISLLTSNDNETYTARVDNMAVDITQPYDPSQSVLVRVPTLNSTDMAIVDEEGKRGVQARFVKLVVQGTASTDEEGGAHIAEIVVQ